MVILKRIDKLVLGAFIGPFILTFVVVVFILLITQMLRYLDEIFGKGIGIDVLGQFIFHFSIFQTPVAIPLAVMLASLIAFGNLGEHSEITAIKSAGISLSRVLFPIFIFVILVSCAAFYSNSYLVPKSALKAYSLLYDIRQKKPTLDIKEGLFYEGLDNFRIKVDYKYPDGRTLKGVIIYDHSKGLGNTDVIVADSGRMYTILNDRYLKLELYDGNYYSEEATISQLNRKIKVRPFNRTSFDKTEIVFDLSIFDLKRTKEELFSTDRFMRNFNQIRMDIDSMQKDIYDIKLSYFSSAQHYFTYYKSVIAVNVPAEVTAYGILRDSLLIALEDTISENAGPEQKVKRFIENSEIRKLARSPTLLSRIPRADSVSKKVISTYQNLTEDERRAIREQVDLYFDNHKNWDKVYKTALGLVRQMKSKSSVSKNRLAHLVRERKIFVIQYQKLTANAVACIIMFLIGAPLGAIIKKGGLGIPVFVSIIFFIIYYVIGMAAEKQSRQNMLDPVLAGWLANIVLLPIGLFSLKQARKDARILELDYYLVQFDNIKHWFLSVVRRG